MITYQFSIGKILFSLAISAISNLAIYTVALADDGRPARLARGHLFKAEIFAEAGASAASANADGTICLDPPKKYLDNNRFINNSAWEYEIAAVNKSEPINPSAGDEKRSPPAIGCPARMDNYHATDWSEYHGTVRGLAPHNNVRDPVNLTIPPLFLLVKTLQQFSDHQTLFYSWVIDKQVVLIEPTEAFTTSDWRGSVVSTYHSIDNAATIDEKAAIFRTGMRKINVLIYQGNIPKLLKVGE